MLYPEIGAKIGKLTLKEIKTFKKENTNRSYTYGLCECSCGKSKYIRIDHLNINNKHYTKTCGCVYSEIGKTKRKTDLKYAYDNWYDKFLRGAKQRKYEVTIDKENIFKYTQQECYYCGKPPSIIYKPNSYESKFIFNGLDRIDNLKGYIKENIVSCCRQCNIAKHTQTQSEFFNMIKNIYEKHLK